MLVSGIAMGVQHDDRWKAGEFYEPYVGRWSREVAGRFLEWLSLGDQRDWLDVGCGTGALTEAIVALNLPQRLVAVDPSAGFLEYAKRRVRHGAVSFETADARALPLEDASVDAAVSGLVLNFVPEPAMAVAEMRRVTRPGRTVAAYVWDYADRMELMRYFWDAAIALDTTAATLDEGRRFPMCRPDPLRELFTASGLHDVTVQPIDIATRFTTFDDYWSPFLGGQGPAPGYAMSLSEERRGALREQLRASLPIRSDGSIHLIARAWAVRGTNPGP